MAVIARAEALASVLESRGELFGPHVWLHPDHGLVAGVFPLPSALFDFSSERAVPVPFTASVGKLSGRLKAPKPLISMLHEAKRVVQICEIETQDAIYKLGSTTQMLVHGLNLIEDARPGTLEKLSQQKKQSKRPVAKTRAQLYDLEHPESHSAPLKSGWYVGTNNKASEARGVLRRAVELAGLIWGTDFSIRRAS